MVSVLPARFQQDPTWVIYFRRYEKDLRKRKGHVRLGGDLSFNCSQCGKCCNFTAQQHRCLLSLADVARWYNAGFEIGLFFVFPVHSIDGYSALGIPTKGEVKSGKFLEWIRPFDDGWRVTSKSSQLIEELAHLQGIPSLLEGDGGNCLYLGLDRRCMIHSIRPGACCMFPYLQKAIIKIGQEIPSYTREETSVPCPPEAFIAEKTPQKTFQQTIRDCIEAEAAAWAQEQASMLEVENLLGKIWREILPKF